MGTNNYCSLAVARCEGCLLKTRFRCKAFTDPEHQWKTGECRGRVTDLDELGQREKEIQDYKDKYCSNKAV